MPLGTLRRKLSTIAVFRIKKSGVTYVMGGKTENREGRNDDPCALSPRVGLLFLSPSEMRIFTYIRSNAVIAYSRRFILKAK